MNGPIRRTSDPALRFEHRPVLIPAAFEAQASQLARWDRDRTTRSVLLFAPPEEGDPAPTLDAVESDAHEAPARLARAEAISRAVVDEIDRVFEDALKGDNA